MYTGTFWNLLTEMLEAWAHVDAPVVYLDAFRALAELLGEDSGRSNAESAEEQARAVLHAVRLAMQPHLEDKE